MKISISFAEISKMSRKAGGSGDYLDKWFSSPLPGQVNGAEYTEYEMIEKLTI